jgi:two-component system sensor histidine kinase UhpB
MPGHAIAPSRPRRAAVSVTPEAEWPRLDAPALEPPAGGSPSDDAVRSLIAAHELERQRISRDLHDSVGQALTAIRLHLEIIRRDPSRSTTVELEATEAIDQVEAALHQVRDLAFEIRPAMLDELGLVAAARSLVARQARISGFAAEFRSDVPSGDPGPDVTSACFWTLREAVTNVSRHAAASRMDVSLVERGSDLVLTVRDDGVGIDPRSDARQLVGRSVRSLGLRGIWERITLVGGRLTIDSEPGRGTTLRASFPLDGTGPGRESPR